MLVSPEKYDVKVLRRGWKLLLQLTLKEYKSTIINEYMDKHIIILYSNSIEVVNHRY